MTEIAEHIDILRRAVRGLLQMHGPVTGDLAETNDIDWPERETKRLEAAREAATARLEQARAAEERAKSPDVASEPPALRQARLARESAEAEVAALEQQATPPATQAPLEASPSVAEEGEDPYKPRKRDAAKAAIAGLMLSAAALLFAPHEAHASGVFTGLPASTSPGIQSTGAPTTGGGVITPNGCIPMDTGAAQGVNPASICVSPSQLDLWTAGGAQINYATVQISAAVPLASTGTDTTPVAGTIYAAQLIIPVAFSANNISCLNGSVASTNNLVYAIYNSSGVLVANTALAGVVASGANSFQAQIPLVSAPVALAAGSYFLAYQTNGTTTRFRTINAGGGWAEGSQTGVFGTLPALSPVPSTFAANVGPVCYVN